MKKHCFHVFVSRHCRLLAQFHGYPVEQKSLCAHHQQCGLRLPTAPVVDCGKQIPWSLKVTNVQLFCKTTYIPENQLRLSGCQTMFNSIYIFFIPIYILEVLCLNTGPHNCTFDRLPLF